MYIFDERLSNRHMKKALGGLSYSRLANYAQVLSLRVPTLPPNRKRSQSLLLPSYRRCMSCNRVIISSTLFSNLCWIFQVIFLASRWQPATAAAFAEIKSFWCIGAWQTLAFLHRSAASSCLVMIMTSCECCVGCRDACGPIDATFTARPPPPCFGDGHGGIYALCWRYIP